MAHPTAINTVEFPPAKIPMISAIQHVPLYKSESFLRKHYLEKMMSIAQIADLISSTRSTVSDNLRRYDIPIRGLDEAHNLRKGQIAFGRRIVNGQEVDHKREHQNLEMMRELRTKGHGYHKIADIFNAMKVPTKNRGSCWHGTTVMKMLKANSSLGVKYNQS